MRSYLASLFLGVAVGLVYGLVKVRSPAPPAIALLGLLGMLAGEQVVLLVSSHLFKSDVQLGAASRDRGEAMVATSVASKQTDGASARPRQLAGPPSAVTVDTNECTRQHDAPDFCAIK
jgi:XapX domain-containing protein